MKPKLLLIIILAGTIAACKKYNYNGVMSPASVTIINAMSTSDATVPLFGVGPAQYWSTRQQIFYGTSFTYSVPKDSSSLMIVPITDTVHSIIFHQTLPVESSGVYSLYLSGNATHPDTLFMKDQIPFYSDSSAGVRFINLSNTGKSFTVNIYGDENSIQFGPLHYQQISDFKKYSAKISGGGSYQFEIRDQATGDSLAMFTWNYKLFNNNTIVIADSGPFYIWPINNY